MTLLITIVNSNHQLAQETISCKLFSRNFETLELALFNFQSCELERTGTLLQCKILLETLETLGLCALLCFKTDSEL